MRLGSLQRALRTAGIAEGVQIDPGTDMQDMRWTGPGRKAINGNGSALVTPKAVAFKTFNTNSHLPDVIAADSNSATAIYKRVIGFVKDSSIADAASGTIVDWLVVQDVVTTGATVGDYVYLKNDATGDWELTANSDKIPIGIVLRAHATTGVVYLTNDLTVTPLMSDTSLALTIGGLAVNLAAGSGLEVSSGLRVTATAAGAGLTGGAGSPLDVGANADGSIVVNANDVQLGRVAGATAPAAGATEAIYGISKLHAAPAVVNTPVVAGANLVLTAGAGLTGGGDLTAARTFDVAANADGSIVANANDIQLGRIAGATAPAAGATSAIYGVSKLHAAPAVADTPVVVGANFTLTSGNGLSGGGNLTADRTLAVGAGNGITVNADDVQIDIGYLRRATGSVSSLQLLALRATPFELVGAPAAGNILVLSEIALFYDYGGTAYTIGAAGDDIGVKYTNGSGAQASATVDSAGLLDAVADKVKYVGRNASDFVAVAGAALVLHNIGAGEWTLGNGVLRYDLTYRTVATGF